MILTPWFWKDLLWSRFFRGTSLKAWKYLRTFGSTLNRSRKSCWPTTFMFLRKTECHVAVMTHFWGWGWHFHDFSIFTILWIGGCILHPQKQIMRKIQKIMTDLKVTLSYIPESDLVTIVWWTALLTDNFSSWSLWAPWTAPSTLPPPPDSRCHCAAGRAWPRCRRSGPWCRGIAAEPDSSDGTGRACRVCPPARQCYQCWWPSRAPHSSQAERASPADRGGHLHCQGHHDEPVLAPTLLIRSLQNNSLSTSL